MELVFGSYKGIMDVIGQFNKDKTKIVKCLRIQDVPTPQRNVDENGKTVDAVGMLPTLMPIRSSMFDVIYSCDVVLLNRGENVDVKWCKGHADSRAGDPAHNPLCQGTTG